MIITNRTKAVAGSTIVGLCLGLGTGYLIWGLGGGVKINKNSDAVAKSVQQEVEKNQAAVVASLQSGAEYIEVADQPAGKSVSIQKAKLSSLGWIAVHENINGELGNVLGARAYATGEHVGVFVPLLRGTTAGQTYHVGIYKENGDGKFDRKIDTLMRAEDGEMIGGSFVAQ
ncbi:MAG: hypothetical protein U0522_03470 [Candidatus Paceibacterota bacterium]